VRAEQVATALRSSRRVHDHGDARQAEHGTNDIPQVGRRTVDSPSPEQREQYKHSAVSGVNAAEMGWLKRWNDAVKKEHEAPQDTQGYGPTRPEPLPNKPAATDFAQTGKNEQDHGFGDAWEVHPTKIAHVERS